MTGNLERPSFTAYVSPFLMLENISGDKIFQIA